MSQKIQIRYAIQYATHEVTQAEAEVVYAMYHFREPQRLQAVKFIRNQYGIGLKEAKDICDAIGAQERVIPNYTN